MKTVSHSESEFLGFVRTLVGGPGHPEAALKEPHKLPKKMGPDALQILQNLLAKGAVLALVRGGGHRNETRPAHDLHVQTGTLWSRHSPPNLRFTAASMELLQWAYTEPLESPRAFPTIPESVGLGDRIVTWMLARTLVETVLPDAYRAVLHEPLAVLQLAGRALPDTPPDWNSWLPEGAVLLEGLGEFIGESWAHTEREKMSEAKPERVIVLGRAQQLLLDPFLSAARAAGRIDLADFLLVAGELLLPYSEGSPPHPDGLRTSTTLRQRTLAARCSASLYAAITELERDKQEAGTTRFFDDTYPAAQAQLRRWERFGEARTRAFREAATFLQR